MNFGKRNLRLVIDANEYIFAFGISEESPYRTFLDYLLTHSSQNSLFICRSIVSEVQRNLIALYLKQFCEFVDPMVSVDAEHVKANFLVSENRHFLSRRHDLPFRIVTASDFLKLLSSKN